MKDIRQLSKDLAILNKKINENLKKANRETAELIWEDTIERAPTGTGEYISSIQLGETKDDGSKYTTEIFTNLQVGPAKSTGKVYLLGYLLETGTDPHAIPNAFDWGRIYGYESEKYKRTLDPNWHPGTIAQPHFNPALLKNEETHKRKIKEALSNAIKETIK